MRIAACALLSGLLAALEAGRSDARQGPLPDLRDLLARYARAVDDAGSPEIARLESTGTLTGGGLSGAFHTWIDGDHERTDQNLGPRSEKTLRIADRLWYADSDGDVREFTGVLARRARTQRFIDSGDFAQEPERLSQIKSKLERNRASARLFDTRLFAASLEAAYCKMMERSEAGLPPDHIHVNS